MSHTEPPKLICGSRYFPQGLGQCIGPTLVCAQEGVEVTLQEASASVGGICDLDRGDGARQSRVLVDLVDIKFKISRDFPQATANS
jgi:hypothetical protein